MNKLLFLVLFLLLSACGYKITKIDLPEPLLQELREKYPTLKSGKIILYIENKDE